VSPKPENESSVNGDTYDYEPMVGLHLPYERDEFEDYLNNRKKCIVMESDIAVWWNTDEAGILLEM
jgi:hypothetical protein